MEHDAGAIIVNDGKYLVIESTEGYWGFPKGHLEGGETVEEAAKREVKEETNLDIEFLGPKDEIIYRMPKGADKKITYFLARPLNLDIVPQEIEAKDFRWLTYEEVVEKLSFDDTRELFKRIVSKA